jgi:ABC-2 type transport system permease protein
LVNQVDLSWQSLLVVPLIIELYVFALGLAFFLSALNVKFRDIGYLWEIFLQAAFYATPILYPLAMVIKESEFVAKLMLLNPVAQVIQDARYVLVTRDTLTGYQMLDGVWMFVPFVCVGIVVYLAAHYFRKNSKTFAENI